MASPEPKTLQEWMARFPNVMVTGGDAAARAHWLERLMPVMPAPVQPNLLLDPGKQVRLKKGASWVRWDSSGSGFKSSLKALLRVDADTLMLYEAPKDAWPPLFTAMEASLQVVSTFEAPGGRAFLGDFLGAVAQGMTSDPSKPVPVEALWGGLFRRPLLLISAAADPRGSTVHKAELRGKELELAALVLEA